MNLHQRAVKSLFWAGAAQGGRLAFQLLIMAVLAHFLMPSDFGLIAMATVFVEFALILVDFGIGRALIQKQDIRDAHFSTALWFHLAAGVLCYAVFWVAAPLVSLFYARPELTGVIRFLSLDFILAAIGFVPQALLQRQMNFKALAQRDMAAIVIAGCAGVVAALNGWGVWSLALYSVVFTAMSSCLLWFFSRWRPRAVFDRSALGEILHFSANVTGINFVTQASRNVDQLLIGRFLGAQPLGYYALAARLILLPIQNVSWVVTRVLFPAFSRIQEDLNRLAQAYLRVIESIAMLAFPLMALIFILIPDFVTVFYGEKWNPVIFLVRALACCGLLQSLSSTVSLVFMALGKPQVLFKFSLFISFPATVLAVLWGMRFGVMGVALAYTLRTFGVSFLLFLLANRRLGVKMSEFFRRQLPGVKGFVLVALLAVAAGMLIDALAPAGSLHLRFAVKCLVAMAGYSVFILTEKRLNVVGEIRNGAVKLQDGYSPS